MRRVRYVVAMSLDAYIAGPKGESDWIIMDPQIDFKELFAQFDTFLMGRRTYMELKVGPFDPTKGNQTIVFSHTLKQEDHPDVTIVADNVDEAITSLRSKPGKDIWLFGGGLLFQGLLDAGLVDTIEVAVIPVLLGGGIPLLPSCAKRAALKLTGQRVYKTGIVSLEYAVVNGLR